MGISKRDPVKLPTFSGNEGEDYLAFKEELLKGLVQNRVIRSDKLSKLRDCLKGDALKLVPESITADFDEAISTLDKAFGKSIRIVRYKKDQLLKLGFHPNMKAKGGTKAVVEWYINVESILQSLLDLGSQDDANAMEIWNDSAIDEYCDMFPYPKNTTLLGCPAQFEDKLRAILAKISRFREEFHKLHLAQQNKNRKGLGGNVGCCALTNDEEEDSYHGCCGEENQMVIKWLH